MTELEPRAGERLERTLDRYTRVRLDPSPAQVKRARAAVMEAAWRQRLDVPTAPATTASAPVASLDDARRRRGLFAGWGARRLGVSFAAAVMAGLLVGSTAFAASRAGAPLYNVRLALEELTLPTDGQARLEAEIAQAQGRVAEIVDAVSKDDAGAVAAAVTAYERSLDDLDESTGGPAARALQEVESHRDVLLAVLARAPEDAKPGLENAVARSSVVIARLAAAVNAAAPSTNGADGGTGASGGTGAGSGSGSGSTGGGTNNGQGPDGNNGQGPDSNNGNGAKPSREPQQPAASAPVEDPTKEIKTPKPADGNKGGKP